MKRKDIDSDSTMSMLLKQEFQTLEDTIHPNIVRVYELMKDDKFYFVVLELMPNGELLQYIE